MACCVWAIGMDHCQKRPSKSYLDPIMVILMACFGRELREHRIFLELLKICPDLEEKLLSGSAEEVELLADLVRYCSPCHTVWF
jgi:hypothetical protein